MLAPRMEPSSRPSFNPAGAGFLLASVTFACTGLGALIGWLAGSFGYGVAFGAVVGVPVGVATTVVRYRNI